MTAKLTRLAHRIAIQLRLVRVNCTFAVLAPGGQFRNFWIHPRIDISLGAFAASELDIVFSGYQPR